MAGKPVPSSVDARKESWEQPAGTDTPPPAARRHPPPRVLVALGVAAGALLLAVRPEEISLAEALLALAIIGCGLAPSLVWFHRDSKRVPVFEVSCLFYVVSFGLSVFLFDVVWLTDQVVAVHRVRLASRADGATIVSLGLVLAGLIAYVGVFFAARRRLPRRLPPLRLPRDDGSSRLIVLLWLLLAGHLAYLALPAVRAVPSIGQFLQPVGFLAIGMFWVLYRRRAIGRRHAAFIFLVIFPLVLMLTLSTSFLTPVMLWGIFLFFVLYRESGRLPVRLLVAFAVFLFVAYAAVGGYRAALGGHHHRMYANLTIAIGPDSGIIAKMRTLVEVTVKMWTATQPDVVEAYTTYPQVRAVSAAIRRVTLLPLFTQVVDRTPEPVPYWRGETYGPLLTSMIPRLLWPDKPREVFGGEFGRRYGFIAEGEPTSINLPWIVEMFANFGVAGVVFGMAAAGLLMALLDRLFNDPRMSRLEAITGLMIITPLVYQESNLSLMVGSIVPLTLSVLAFFWVGLGVPRRRRPPAG